MKEPNDNYNDKIDDVISLARANTTPIEDYTDIIEGEDILNTYNYYCYYHAQKPFNPRLKKPKYKPTPDYEFIRSGLPEKSNKNNDNSSNVSFSKDLKEKSEEFTQMLESLNLKEKSVSNNNLDKDEYYPIPTGNFNTFNDSINQPHLQNSYLQGNSYPNQNFNNQYFLNPMPNQINPLIFMNQNNILQNNIIEQHKLIQRNNLYIPTQTYYPTGFNSMPYNNQLFNPMWNPNMKQINPREVNSIDFMTCYYDIIENLVVNCKTYLGSKLIQEILPLIPEKERIILFEKITPFIYELSEDQYGNYVIQKIIEIINLEKREIIYKNIEGKMYSLSIDMYGCRVLQKLIELINESIVKTLLNEIENDIKYCILNKNGNHVIQKFIQRLPKGEFKQIINVVAENTFEIAINQFGCRVIQRIIELGTEDEKDIIFNNLLLKFTDLIIDQYGNYVIQHFIERRGSAMSKEIYDTFTGRVFELCTHKYASNVIEKSLKFGSPKQVIDIINELYQGEENDKLLTLINDKFGNYCVQKMIEYSPKNIQFMIIKKIASLDLKSGDGYSKHIVDFIEKKGYPKPGSFEFQKLFK